MRERTILLQPRDPVIFRDGKPFSAGLSCRTMPWPMPSALIGSIRTRLARSTDYDPATVTRLLRIQHLGPFLAVEDGPHRWALAFHAPADAVAYDAPEGRIELRRLRPADYGAAEGTDLPAGLHPLVMQEWREEKPSERSPAFWKAKFASAWLSDCLAAAAVWQATEIGFPALKRQRRMHVAIERASRTAEEGMLFATEGLEFEDRVTRWAICSRIRHEADGEDGDWGALEAVSPVGGEQRLAYWSEPGVEWPSAPPTLAGVRRLRLQLVTPGLFSGGWKPGWIGDDLVGSPPAVPELGLKLIAAAVPRPQAISGWDYAARAAKPTRFVAPAGSVYFFEVLGEQDPSPLWMTSICDDEQAGLDGFGLVLCGEWQWL